MLWLGRTWHVLQSFLEQNFKHRLICGKAFTLYKSEVVSQAGLKFLRLFSCLYLKCIRMNGSLLETFKGTYLSIYHHVGFEAKHIGFQMGISNSVKIGDW